jgi:hypothetical protein
MTTDDLEARVSELEQNLQYLRDDFDNWRSQVYQPQHEKTVEKRDDAREQRVELQAAVDALSDRVAELERTLDSVVGVEDANASDPAKRANDLRLALVQEADSRDDDHAGRAQMWYKEVKRLFRRTGHGDVSDPDCFKAMRWAAGDEEAPESFRQNAAGFKMTSKTNPNGQEVKAVAVDKGEVETAKLPSKRDSGVNAPVSDPTNGETVVDTENTEK